MHVLFFLIIIDSNSNLAKTVKKSEEPVPVSSGSTRHFREGNALDLGMLIAIYLTLLFR
jgi:hypothetical protein